MPKEETIMVYITCKDEDEAMSISRTLLEERLVACANMFPIRSLYRWERKMEDERETAVLSKSRREHTRLLVARIKELHSYEVPCIEIVKVDGGDPDFLGWVRDETRGK